MASRSVEVAREGEREGAKARDRNAGAVRRRTASVAVEADIAKAKTEIKACRAIGFEIVDRARAERARGQPVEISRRGRTNDPPFSSVSPPTRISNPPIPLRMRSRYYGFSASLHSIGQRFLEGQISATCAFTAHECFTQRRADYRIVTVVANFDILDVSIR